MLPELVWKMPLLGTFNLHASLLPQYRGAAPINRVIMNGETETGLTTFLLNDKIDEGNILLQKRMPIARDETAGSLHDRMMELGKGLVVETVKGLANNGLSPKPQAEAGKLQSAPKIFKEDCRIDWNNDLITIYNQIRGLSPYPAAFTMLINKGLGEELLLKVYEADIVQAPSAMEKFQLVTDNKSFIKVSHPEGFLILKQIQAPGKKVMQVRDFLNGFQLTGNWQIAF